MRLKLVFSLVRGLFSGTSLKDLFKFGQSEGDEKKKKRSLIRKAGGGAGKVLLFLLILMALASYLFMFGLTFNTYEVLGQVLGFGSGLSLSFCSFISFIMLLVFSFMMSIDMLFKGRDLAMLRTMPLTDAEITVSRVIAMYLYMLPLHMIMAVPAVVIYLLYNPFCGATIPGILITVLVLPLVPVCLAALLGALTAKIGGKGPGRLVMQLTLIIVIVVLFSLLQMGKLSNLDPTEAASLEEYSQMGGALGFVASNLESILRVAPMLRWNASLMGSGALTGSLLAVGTTLVLCALCVWGVSSMFYGICSSMESEGKGRSHRAAVEPVYRRSSQLRALLSREWYILRSSSSFMIEIIGESLVPVLILVMWGAMGMLGQMTSGLVGMQGAVYFPLIVCGILLLVQGLDMVSATSVSRQGKLFYTDRVFPVDYRVLINAKLLMHLTLAFAPNVLYTIAVTVLFGLGIWDMLWIILVNFIFAVGMCYLGLSLDYTKPNLTWKNPQQAVKNNLNGLKSMGLCAATVLITGGVCVLLILKVDYWPCYIWVPAALTGILVLARRFAMKAASERLC